MASRAIDTLAEQIADPLEGSYLRGTWSNGPGQAAPGSMKPLTPKLLDLLARSTKPTARETIITALGEIGPQAAAAVPVLLELVEREGSRDRHEGRRGAGEDRSAGRRDQASGAARMDGAQVTIPPFACVRWRRCGDLGTAAASAIPALLTLADEQDLAISAGAIEAISKIDPEMGQHAEASHRRR